MPDEQSQAESSPKERDPAGVFVVLKNGIALKFPNADWWDVKDGWLYVTTGDIQHAVIGDDEAIAVGFLAGCDMFVSPMKIKRASVRNES